MRRLGLLVLAIALPSCMRGCNPGCRVPAEECSETADCPSRTTCRNGYCVDQHYATADDSCRKSTACVERGECSAIPRNSLFGLDTTLECAAVTDEDCKPSKLCRERGQCARNPRQLGCAATGLDACRASERCATHEECELGNDLCVRRWTGCPPLALPGAPAWLSTIRLDWDYESLRAPWHPGDVEHATLACRVTGHGTPATRVRVAGQCAPGPQLDRGTGTFLHADLALHAGTAIAFAADGAGPTSSFAQLRYDGSSPIFGGSGDETIECVVVSPAVALERASRELAAVDRGLAQANREQPDLDTGRPDVSPAVEEARVHAQRAALWLGWNRPELALRVVRLDTAVSAARARLDAAIRKVAVTDKPVRGARISVTRSGPLCGDALRARLAGAPATDCALELVIENTSPAPIVLTLAGNEIGALDALVWLHPSSADQPASVAPALVASARVGTTTTTAGAIELPAGQRAQVLISGATPGALLRGRLDLHTTFAMRGS